MTAVASRGDADGALALVACPQAASAKADQRRHDQSFHETSLGRERTAESSFAPRLQVYATEAGSSCAGVAVWRRDTTPGRTAKQALAAAMTIAMGRRASVASRDFTYK